MCDAGNEVADALLSGEWRHGSAIGQTGTFRGIIPVFSFRHFRPVNVLPCGVAACDGGVLLDGIRCLGHGYPPWSGGPQCGRSLLFARSASLFRDFYCALWDGNYLQMTVVRSVLSGTGDGPEAWLLTS